MFAPRYQANDLAEANDPVSEKEEVAPELWERSAAVNEPLLYVTYPYPEHINSALTNNLLFTEQANWENWFMC